MSTIIDQIGLVLKNGLVVSELKILIILLLSNPRDGLKADYIFFIIDALKQLAMKSVTNSVYTKIIQDLFDRIVLLIEHQQGRLKIEYINIIKGLKIADLVHCTVGETRLMQMLGTRTAPKANIGQDFCKDYKLLNDDPQIYNLPAYKIRLKPQRRYGVPLQAPRHLEPVRRSIPPPATYKAPMTNEPILPARCRICLVSSSHGLGANMNLFPSFECFICRVKKLDMLFKVEDSLGVPKLMSSNNIMFEMTPEQVLRVKTPGNKYHVFVTLFEGNAVSGVPKRMPYLMNVNYGASMTQNTTVTFGGKKVDLSRYGVLLPSNQVRIGSNSLTIQGYTNRYQPITLTVQVIALRSLHDMTKSIEEKSSTAFTRQDALKKVIATFGSQDDDIVTTSSILSLSCPLTLCKIKVPARGRNCTHTQCFELSSFLSFYMGKLMDGLICIVCDKKILLNEFVVDPLLKEVFSEITDPDIEEIEFFPDGSWKPRRQTNKNESTSPERPGSVLVDTSKTVANRVSILNLTEESTTVNNSNKPPPQVVDLTLSSDEETEEPLPKRRKQTPLFSTIRKATPTISDNIAASRTTSNDLWCDSDPFEDYNLFSEEGDY